MPRSILAPIIAGFWSQGPNRVKAIAADPNYSNVSVVVEPFSQLGVPAPVDLVWTSQNYHDLHNLPGLDVGVFNKMVFDDLKPGGIYLVLDHTAETGSAARDTATLHRIDPESVKQEVLAAGFVFVGSSNLLKQPGDDHAGQEEVLGGAAADQAPDQPGGQEAVVEALVGRQRLGRLGELLGQSERLERAPAAGGAAAAGDDVRVRGLVQRPHRE